MACSACYYGSAFQRGNSVLLSQYFQHQMLKCCNEWCVVLNHYDLGLYVESWLKSFVISGLPGLWELKYRNLIASVIVFVLTFLWFGRFCYNVDRRNFLVVEKRYLHSQSLQFADYSSLHLVSTLRYSWTQGHKEEYKGHLKKVFHFTASLKAWASLF